MFLRIIVLSLALLALTGCKGFIQSGIDEAGSTEAANLSPFESYLESGYLELAQNELSEDDFRDAQLFLHRVRQVRSGANTLPTEVSSRKFTPQNEAVVTQARSELMRFLDGGARQNRPEIAARAQVMFDCWAQELEEDRQPQDISLCRDSFSAAIGGLQGIASTVGSSGSLTVEGDTVNVFFPLNVHSRAASGEPELLQLAAQAVANGVQFVLITANSDSSGSMKYNYELSVKRGEYVRDVLVQGGIDASIISIVALGERNLPVSTGDGVKEPRNRRAKVEFRY